MHYMQAPGVWSPPLHPTHATTRTQSHAHTDGSPFGDHSGRDVQKRVCKELKKGYRAIPYSLCSRLFRTLVIARSRLSRPHVSNRCTHPFTPVRHHVRHTWHERTRHPARVTQTEWCPHGAYTIPFRVPVRPRRPPPPRPRPFASNVSFASHAFTHTTTHILCGSLPVSVPSHR